VLPLNGWGRRSSPSRSSRSKACRTNPAVVPPAVQVVKDRQAVGATTPGLAVDRGRGGRERGHGLDYAGVAVGPVVAAPGEQADPAVTLAGDPAVAVVLDLVNPLRTDRGLRYTGRDARFDNACRLAARPSSYATHVCKMANGGRVSEGRMPAELINRGEAKPTAVLGARAHLRTRRSL
jgi:hypothetical protein